MKVKDLIEALKNCNPESVALVMDFDAAFVPVKGISEGDDTLIICDEDTYLGFLE